MQDLRELRIKTNCDLCTNKCCSQPYDWVYLTARDIAGLETASALSEEEFAAKRRNANTGHIFRTLNLPCRFLDSQTGQCKVYDFRPLVCRLFPFYPEALTGNMTLLPSQCGANLVFLASNSGEGWCLKDVENDARRWLAELWDEAMVKE